jgi:hypothetical protein
MRKRCLNCKHWQGNSQSKYGDCHYILGEIAPHVKLNVSLFGWNLTLPFDPHDVKYFPGLNDRLLFMSQKEMPTNVVMDVRKEEDIKFILSQYDGKVIGERMAPIKLVHFKSFRDKEGCTYYETLNG